MSSTSQFTCALFEFLQQNDAIQKILFDKCGLHCQCIFLARWQTHYCYPCFEFQQQVDSCFHTETQRPHSTFQLVSSLPFTHKYLGWGVSFLGLAPCPPLQLTLSSVQIRLQIQMNTHKQKHLRKTKIKKTLTNVIVLVGVAVLLANLAPYAWVCPLFREQCVEKQPF